MIYHISFSGILVTSYLRYGGSNLQHLLVNVNNKQTTNAQYHWPFESSSYFAELMDKVYIYVMFYKQIKAM